MTNTTSSSTSSTTVKTATYFTFDHFNKQIVGTEQNFKKSGISGTAQYKALMAAMDAHPTYSLSAISPKVKKQSYKGLNFDLMMDYVEFKGTEVQKAEFEQHVNDGDSYPTIKSWFLDNFKVGFTVEKAKREIAEHKLGARKAKVRATVKAKVVKAIPAVVAMPTASNF
ncbi:MAG: hypothetical protein J6C98_00665 [Oscillospiraceae bacterium]|nr:hypothetical protein [Oscillospiraceae bacterium]